MIVNKVIQYLFCIVEPLQVIGLKIFNYFLITLFFSSAVFSQQYYLRGEVIDESGNVLQNVTILQHRTGYLFKSGSSGTFGIITHQQVDTLSFSLEGFKTEKIVANANHYLSVKLKVLPANASRIRRDKLASLTKNLEKEEQRNWFTGDESYASLLENHFINASKFPNTGMSLNVDRASYSNVRRFITLNTIVPPDAVRVEEMLNYFNLDYHKPDGEDLFKFKTSLSSCPWNPDNQLLYINLSAKKLNLDTLPPSHLVFLIDVSGSMDMPNRLPLLQASFKMLVNNLREKDSVAIVVYGGVTGVMLNTTSGCEKEKILKVIDELNPGGNTPGESGIKLAYSVARNHFIEGGNNRVILATDGDFNVGLKTEQELAELITSQKESRVYLTCLGVGMGNYKDSKIHMLAEKGNGNFAYLDKYQEAEKVLLKEFTQTLYSVADNVYMDVAFNPEWVKEYRLIGFDNKVGALRDSLSSVEGGEIGSGHSMLAIFEIAPTDINKNAVKDDFTSGTLADIILKYQLPDDTTKHQFIYKSQFDFVPASELEKCYHFSAAVAMFGSLLRSSPFLKNVGWSEIITLAQTSSESNNLLQKDFLNLLQQAKILYSKGKKKKGR